MNIDKLPVTETSLPQLQPIIQSRDTRLDFYPTVNVRHKARINPWPLADKFDSRNKILKKK